MDSSISNRQGFSKEGICQSFDGGLFRLRAAGLETHVQMLAQNIQE